MTRFEITGKIVELGMGSFGIETEAGMFRWDKLPDQGDLIFDRVFTVRGVLVPHANNLLEGVVESCLPVQQEFIPEIFEG